MIKQFSSVGAIILPVVLLIGLLPTVAQSQTALRARDAGLAPGVMQPGRLNAITDVPGVRVGQVTLIEGDNIRTGVTAVVPHNGNLFQQKVPAAIYVGNGFGKLGGSTQVQELGNMETPVVLTNTLAVPVAMQALIENTLNKPGNEAVQSVNAVVGETNDGYLNDIRGMHVKKEHIWQALAMADTGRVEEGNVGAGTGTVCFGWKGGIGTASRKLPAALGGFTVGVLVQANFGGVLKMDGVPAGKMLGKYYLSDKLNNTPDGSCMMVVATDAPLDARNLERLAKRAFMGMANTGGIASNGSGDYVIAFSTNPSLSVPHNAPPNLLKQELLHNDAVSPLFMAAIEATEEAIFNALFAAKTMQGKGGRQVDALPVEKLLPIIKKGK